jgi:hypothetical protein
MVLGRLYTLAELKNDLWDSLNDPDHTRWSDSEITQAVNQSIVSAGNVVKEERTYLFTFDSETYEYDLPPATDDVLELRVLSDEAPYQLAPSWWEVRGGKLHFRSLSGLSGYAGKSVEMTYEVAADRLLDLEFSATGVGGVLVLGASSTELDAQVAQLRPGDKLLVNGESMVLFDWSLTAVDGYAEDQWVLDVGDSTVPDGACTVSVAKYTGVPYPYLINMGMALAYERGSRNRTGVEVEEAVQRGSYHRQLADIDLKRHRRSARPVRRF